MTTAKLKYLYSDVTRHGRRRWFVRRHGRRIPIPGPATSGFAQAYEAALDEVGRPQQGKRTIIDEAKVGTLRWLANRYYASTTFTKLDKISQRTRIRVLEGCMNEPTVPNGKRLMGEIPLAYFSSAHAQLLRDRRADKPGAANNRKKYLGALFGWAVEDKTIPMVTSNPVNEIAKIEYHSDGFKTWEEAELDVFESYFPIGTKARAAVALLLLLGVRRSDVVRLGPGMVRDGWITFVPQKLRDKKPDPVSKPWLPELARIIAETRLIGTETFLVTDYGRPFTAAGFGNWFRERCHEAGLMECSPHGLRKLGATRAAEAGATHHQLMALFDWSSAGQALKYIRAAENKKATALAMPLLARRRAAAGGGSGGSG